MCHPISKYSTRRKPFYTLQNNFKSFNMSNAQEIQLNRLNIIDRTHKDEPPLPQSSRNNNHQAPTAFGSKKPLKWWIHIFIYAFMVLAGQSTAVLLLRLYFENGGQSNWMATLVQFMGFPVLLPFYYIFPSKHQQQHHQIQTQEPTSKRSLKIGSIYIGVGLLIAFNGMLSSLGILYLPVSTYSLISASQLAFTAVFAFFLNKQKFTPYIVNSLVILTISSTLLIFETESSNTDTSRSKYIVGFVCTVAAAAGYGLMPPLTQFAFQKVIMSFSFTAVLNMLVAELFVASCAGLVGLFASGEWKTLKGEMHGFALGKVSYVMTLIWTALSWQVFYLGTMKLITEVSSLFSNVISTVCLPVVPVLAVFIFHDKMNGLKVVALVLAVWGFASYAYQCYDENEKGKEARKEESVEV